MFLESSLAYFRLKGTESELLVGVAPNYKIDKAIAQVAYPIKENYLRLCTCSIHHIASGCRLPSPQGSGDGRLHLKENQEIRFFSQL